MRGPIRVVAASAVLASGLLGVAPPAQADVIGMVHVVEMVGDGSVAFSCGKGSLFVGDTDTEVPCADLSIVKVVGDGGRQTVDARGLDDPLFKRRPWVDLDLGAGNDVAIDTRQADYIVAGTGDDSVTIRAGYANKVVDLGIGEGNSLTIEGSEEADVITVVGTTDFAADWIRVHMDRPEPSEQVITGARSLRVDGAGGNDNIDTSGVPFRVNASVWPTLDGGPGANRLRSTSMITAFRSRGGSAVMIGGHNPDSFESASQQDAVFSGEGHDRIKDLAVLTGGRVINFGNDGTYESDLSGGDVTVRVRRGGAPTPGPLVTASLRRQGRQHLIGGSGWVALSLRRAGTPPSRNLADIEATSNGNVELAGDPGRDDLVDVTVPTGTWSTSGTLPGSFHVYTHSQSIGDINLSDVGSVRVHGPWTNRNEGWVHRIHRDLLFDWATDSEREAVAAVLDAGTLTREQVASAAIDSDEYRELDVERILRGYLRRPAAPSDGTTVQQWVAALRTGTSLATVRASFLGSDEYFTTAGGSPVLFVTQLFGDVLHRAPTKSELMRRVAALDGGASRAEIAAALLATEEAREAIVEDQVLRFLNRYPTRYELEAWVSPLLTSPTGEQDMILSLAASTEYFDAT